MRGAYRSFAKVAKQRMRSLQKHKTLTVLFLVATIVYTSISILRHIHFGSGGYDLTIFDEAIHNYSQFREPASPIRGFDNLLGDHFHPILALLAPLYWIWDSAVMLFIAQGLLVASAAFPVYLFSRAKNFSKKHALIIVGILLLNAMLIRVVWFDFHEVAFAVPLVAWFVYALEFKKWRLLYVAAALLLLTKESLSLFIAFAGIFLLFRKQFIHGSILVALGIGSFLLLTKVAMPYFAGTDSYGYWSYTQLGPDLFGALVGVATNPLFAFSLFFWPLIKVVTLARMSLTVLGLCYASPLVLLSLPVIAERFLSSTPNHWMFGFHYGAVIAPIFVLAFVDALRRLSKRKGRVARLFKNPRVVPSILWVTLGVNAVMFVVFTATSLFNPAAYFLTNDEKVGYRLMAEIPKDAKVCTSNRLAPHLVRRQIHMIGDGRVIGDSGCNYFVTSSDVDQSDSLAAAIQEAKNQGFIIDKAEGSWTILRREQQ